MGKGCRLGHRLAKCVRNVPDQQPGGTEEQGSAVGFSPESSTAIFSQEASQPSSPHIIKEEVLL